MSSSLEKISQPYAAPTAVSSTNYLMDGPSPQQLNLMNSNHLISGLSSTAVANGHPTNLIGLMSSAAQANAPGSNNTSALGGRKHSDMLYTNTGNANQQQQSQNQ